MSLKKYEIITVGSDKRVRALRSWQVGYRYVNIGDVGGIVYDEKTLSQDGACWLFRGNFGFPGARIGGDSIVDVGEAALSATGTPNVDILGSSVVVGSKLSFQAEQTNADAVVLTAADFEPGTFNYAVGVNWETMKAVSNGHIRSKAPIFSGGVPVTVKCAVAGYAVTWYTTDADGIVTSAASSRIVTGAGVSFTVPVGQYFLIRLQKEPIGTIVPADATAAAITFTGLFNSKLVVIDSRLEINPATSTGTVTIRPGGFYPTTPGAKYPDSVIRNSKVVINGHATADRVVRLISEFAGCNVVIDATLGQAHGAGVYSNVKNLTFTGSLVEIRAVNAHFIIQATDCDNFAVSPTVFPGLAAALTANMPFIFQGCNVPNGIFYHHAQIANTYKNIDFALAQADLGKQIANPNILVSSEVEGMYRLYSAGLPALGALVESHESAKSIVLNNIVNSYSTTIYKDAYLNGPFDFAGTNVFGNKVRSNPLAQVLNVQPRAVQGTFNTVTVGETITGVVYNSGFVCVPTPFRVNGSKGLVLDGVPSNFIVSVILTDMNNVVKLVEARLSGLSAAGLLNMKAFIRFRKSDNSPITPADLAGVTVTVYNGCKIVNTGETAVSMKGNIRVEDNATLVNASVTGSGYFGGNAVMSGMNVNGYAYMKDNAICTKTSENVQTFAGLVMEGNAVYNSIASLALNGLKVYMYDNSKVLGELRSVSPVLIMRDNATITAAGNLSGASAGIVTVKDDAVINTSTTLIGDITLSGNYKGNVVKTWTGKRVIDNENAPEYDNNVKTQYDF